MSNQNLTKQPDYIFTEGTNLHPIGRRIMAEVEDSDRTTASGILLPEKDRSKPLVAKVLAVGIGDCDHCGHPGWPVKPGDRIIFERYAGTPIKSSDQPAVLFLEYADIVAVIQ